MDRFLLIWKLLTFCYCRCRLWTKPSGRGWVVERGLT